MELNIKLNAEELKAAIESEALMTLIERCSYAGPDNRMLVTTTPATVDAAAHSTPGAAAVPIAQGTVAPAPAVPVAPVAPAPLMEEEPAITQGAPVYNLPMSVPTSAPKYTADDLANAAVLLMEKAPERQQEMIALIHSFGVQAIPQIPEDRRGEFAIKLRELGAEL